MRGMFNNNDCIRTSVFCKARGNLTIPGDFPKDEKRSIGSIVLRLVGIQSCASGTTDQDNIINFT
ncbi:hypothetical protein P5673_010966 [Acropora cervicornis]|uniref:Uncharacterized protein n=1 Tax=Acropora cervicornis TaxID=6130 RepID=A0AAD9QQ64_ACRCE|nr:hypothetical protein P5673_010966 [Acropora cervicornis]